VKFEMSGRKFEFDFAPEKLMGDEMLLIDDVLPAGYAERWAAKEVGFRDVLVWAYLAAKRAGETPPFDEFVKTMAPATFRMIEDDPGEPVNREARRAKAKAAPKAKPEPAPSLIE
jgi:hypothetical protein